MSTKKGNKFFNGNTGKVWIDGVEVLNCHKASGKKKYKYEDVPLPTGNGSARVEVGHTIEISLSYRKTGEEKTDLFEKSDDISVIISESNIDGTKIKRVKYDGVTFDEETLSSFEKGKVGEIELSGQAETIQILQDY